ncbi:MAG: hypothetical protein EXS05_22110 [Planctomycetaceae bacterium]|nr:hypothetical protein [Planctomycetaceae bacterium]
MAEFNASFFERGMDIIPLLNQVDGDSDVTGDWVKLTNYSRAMILVAKYGTEDVDTLGFEIVQATTATGTGIKACEALYPYWYKQGVLTAATVWTSGRLTTADSILGIGSAAPTGGTLIVATDTNTDAALVAIDVQASDIDIDGGFDWLTVRIEGDEVNNACLVSAWMILMGGRFPQLTPLSAIS